MALKYKAHFPIFDRRFTWKPNESTPVCRSKKAGRSLPKTDTAESLPACFNEVLQNRK